MKTLLHNLIGAGTLVTFGVASIYPALAEEERHRGDNMAADSGMLRGFPDLETIARPTLADGELRFAKSAHVTSLTLDNGAVFHFVEVEPGSVGVLEELPPGTRGIASVRALRHASVADAFYALSEQHWPIPQNLLAASALSAGEAPLAAGAGMLTGEARPQGWARALLSTPGQMQANIVGGVQQLSQSICDDDHFKDVVESYGYNDRNTPKFRLNRKPNSLINFYKYAEPIEGANLTFYKYSVGGNTGSLWSDVDRFISLLAVCAIDNYESENPGGKAHPAYSDGIPQGFSTTHWGPAVRFSYRKPGENWVKNEPMAFKDFAPSEVGKSFGWHFYTGLNWDWRTEIFSAGGDDEFDIGHAVEDL